MLISTQQPAGCIIEPTLSDGRFHACTNKAQLKLIYQIYTFGRWEIKLHFKEASQQIPIGRIHWKAIRTFVV